MTPRDKLLTLLRDAAQAGTLVKLTLGGYRGADKTLHNVLARPIRLAAGPRLQFVWRHTTRDITKNLGHEDAFVLVAELLAADFTTAHLFTTTETAQLDRRRLTIRRAQQPSSPVTDHDRTKSRLIDDNAGWLRALKPTADKVRQIHKFTEILSHLVTEAGLADGRQLRVVDMGCGKGYLTFATRALLNAEVTGIEARPELVELCNRIARDHDLTGLRFEAGNITDTPLATADILIALHACDTATDDAIAAGIKAGAKIIVVAPCCHKELRPQMTAPPVLAGALRHGILLERQAEFVTDALRAALLEWAGFETKVFEFISTEHTAKNLMITAIQRGQAGNAEAVRELAAFYGIKKQRLAEHLEFTL
jgi:SAM-dependent methyltransferase